ncbi:hypothetical protein ACJ41O_009049 [Fusarium nematophilum]
MTTPKGASEATQDFPVRYQNPEWQDAHRELFDRSLTQELETILPPGVDQQEFYQAISEYVGVLGKDGVFIGSALRDFIDPYEMWESEGKRRLPSAAVCPRSNAELHEVLRVSNKYKIPLWTFSRGKNLGYGGPAPGLNGSVALDLHRMNKIIEVSEKHSYAVVEPGVTFQDLYDHCAKNKLKVWPSCPTLGWGSVLGNTLDRGSGWTPTNVHHQNICGLEVMLADGEILRTGQFSMNGNDSAHLSKYSFGPSVEGLFLQSNLGVVVKLGIWLYPQPPAYMACGLDVPDFEDIESAVDALAPLRQNGLIPHTVFFANIVEVVAFHGPRCEFWDGPGSIPDEKLAEFSKKVDWGYWRGRFGLYGHPDVIGAQFNKIKELLEAACPKGRVLGNLYRGENGGLLDPTSVPGLDGGNWVGVPSLTILPLVKFMCPKGGGIPAHGDFSPIVPNDGKRVLEWLRKTKSIFEEQGFDLFCEFYMHERHSIFVHMFIFDKSNPTHRKSVDKIFNNCYQEARALGYAKYRSHVNHMDMVADCYDFNNHAYRRFIEKLKDSLDPNGILSPGKSGIWPARFRMHRQIPDREEKIERVEKSRL